MFHKIPTKSLQEIYDYLVCKPYAEVMHLVKKIENEAVPHQHEQEIAQKAPEVTPEVPVAQDAVAVEVTQ